MIDGVECVEKPVSFCAEFCDCAVESFLPLGGQFEVADTGVPFGDAAFDQAEVFGSPGELGDCALAADQPLTEPTDRSFLLGET